MNDIDDRLVVLHGNANPGLAADICEHLGTRPGKAKVSRFPDGEISVELQRAQRRTNPGGNNNAASGPGQLTFASTPWCNVTIDGQRVGQTPIVNRSLPSGRHRIVCTNPELNLTRRLTVNIQPGQTTRQRIQLR